MSDYEQGNRGLRNLIAGLIVSVLAVGGTIGTLIVTGSGTFNSAPAPTGAVKASKVWHDSTTDRLMSNVANAGARYVTDTGGYTANTVPKASGVGTLGDSGLIDNGSDISTTERFLRGTPTTADATADSIFTASADAMTPLVLQAKSATQSANELEVQFSNGALAMGYSSANQRLGLLSYLTLYQTTCDPTSTNNRILELAGSGMYMSSLQHFKWYNTTDLSGAPDLGLARAGVSQLSLTDSTNSVLQVGIGTVAAYSVTSTVGPDVTIRGRDGNGGTNAGANIILQAGAPAGAGTRGTVQCPGAGANSTAIGLAARAAGEGSIVIGSSANTSGEGQIAIGNAAGGTGANACAVGVYSYTSAAEALALGFYAIAGGARSIAIGNTASISDGGAIVRLADSINITGLHVLRNDGGERFNCGLAGAFRIYAGTQSIIMSNEIDVTQAAIANAGANWTFAVASNVVTVVTGATPHKLSCGQQFITDADYTDNAWVASGTFTVSEVVSATSFKFVKTQAGQDATTETNAGAGITPSDIVITLPTGGTFWVDEIAVVCSTATTVVTQPTVQFGWEADRDGFYAPAITTALTAVRTREKPTLIAVPAGKTSLSAGITTAGAGTAYMVRFMWAGKWIEDE